MSQNPPSETGGSSCSNSSDSDSEVESSHLRPELETPYPFPAEVTSICVDVESDRPGDEPPFTSEFNISDYFSTDALSDFDLAIGSGVLPITNNNVPSESRTDELLEPLGSSRFTLSAENSGFPLPPNRPPQCSASDSVSTNNSTNFLISSTSLAAPLSSTSFSSSSSSATFNTVVTSTHEQSSSLINRTKNRQLMNNASSVANVNANVNVTAASILSKSLTSPTNNKSNVVGGAKVLANMGNGHQNGPLVVHNSNINNLQSSHLPNNQSSTIILQTQKQAPSNLLPGIITQNNKLVSLRQQIPTSGEITLKSSNRSVGDNIASIVGMDAKKNFLYLTAN